MTRLSVGTIWALIRASIVLLALACLVFGSACAWTYPPRDRLGAAERPHPTAEQLAALLHAPVTSHVRYAALPFSVQLSSRQVNAGSGVWVSCIVPAGSSATWVRFGLEGHTFRGPMANDRIEHRFLIDRVSCGSWTAACWLSTGEVRTQTLESRGECNSGGAS